MEGKLNGNMPRITYFAVFNGFFTISHLLFTFRRNQLTYNVFCIVFCKGFL